MNSSRVVPCDHDEVFYKMDGFLVTAVADAAVVAGGQEVEVGSKEVVELRSPTNEN